MTARLFNSAGVDRDSDAVLRQNLLRWYVEGDGSEVGDDDGIDAGNDEEETRSHRSTGAHATQSEKHGPLVFLAQRERQVIVSSQGPETSVVAIGWDAIYLLTPFH